MRVTSFLVMAFIAILLSAPAGAGGVKERKLHPHVAALASDAFEGREPGTAGEQKTINYLRASWQKAKLKPAANDGSWFAPVSLIQRSQNEAKVTFYHNNHRLKFASDDIILIGREERFRAKAMPVIFGGYGVKSDGRAIGDMSGKLVIMLASTPKYGPEFTSAKPMSLADRRAALISAGAQAVLIVADGKLGNWAAARRKASRKSTMLEMNEKRAELQGAISTKYIVSMVTAAKGDWDRLRRSAKSPDFAGVDLGIDANFDITTNVRRFNSMNVIGKIPGRKSGSGAVLFMAHWDHLGICRPESKEDRICNGALDNASGLAVLTEVARKLAKKRHDRDIYFVATTAEESGLLGAYAFAENPPFPLSDIVVALNIDTIAVAPAGSKVSIIGRGQTELDPIMDNITTKLGRRIDTTTRSNSFLKRQDGWALAQKGVPALMISGSFSNFRTLSQYLGGRYHSPDDEYSEGIDLSGAAEDANLHVAIGKYFASKKRYKRNKTGS